MPDDETLNIKLRKLIETVDIANLLTEPLTSSIRDILAVSASEVGARKRRSWCVTELEAI
jgi:hypothetical protein